MTGRGAGHPHAGLSLVTPIWADNPARPSWAPGLWSLALGLGRGRR